MTKGKKYAIIYRIYLFKTMAQDYYSIFENVRAVGKRYEEVSPTLDYYDYNQLKRKAERMVGKEIVRTMTADEIINLVAGR